MMPRSLRGCLVGCVYVLMTAILMIPSSVRLVGVYEIYERPRSAACVLPAVLPVLPRFSR